MRTKKKPPSKAVFKRVQNRIEDVLYGRVRLDSESPAIQSACQLFIYEGAVEILEINTREGRNNALARVPELIRPYVKAEVMRVWELRKAENEILHHVERAD